MHVIVVNGFPGVGKDQFVQFCTEEIGDEKVLNISTVDYVKTVALGLGWDGVKTPESRRFLSELKRILKEWRDVPYQKTMQDINTWAAYTSDLLWITRSDLWVFIHTREPEEIARFQRELGAYTILIRRPEAEDRVYSNSSDSDVLNFKYDCVIDNSGTLDDLRTAAIAFVKEYE